MENRIIKFRAFWKVVNEMRYFVQGNFREISTNEGKQWAMTFTLSNGDGIYFCEADIMQFTGLLDKKGKESYNGDIIKLYSPYADEHIITEIKYDDKSTAFTVFAEGWFGIDGDIDISTLGWAVEQDMDFEIIGNIFEQPNLIK